MNIFQRLVVYPPSWEVTDKRALSQVEKEHFEEATVVSSEFGLSVCFAMKSGGYGYIPLSTESSAGVGDTLDKDEIVILTLERVGNDPIYRVDTK